jgi:hypothetical protein
VTKQRIKGISMQMQTRIKKYMTNEFLCSKLTPKIGLISSFKPKNNNLNNISDDDKQFN